MNKYFILICIKLKLDVDVNVLKLKKVNTKNYVSKCLKWTIGFSGNDPDNNTIE